LSGVARGVLSGAFIKLLLPAPAARVPPLEDALVEAGALAVSVASGDERTPRFAEPGEADAGLWPDCVVEGLFDAEVDLDAVLAVLAAAGFDPAGARRELLADQDWQTRWREQFVPLEFAGGLWVVPSWHEVPAGARLHLTLDPGMAFGTGTHPTTGLCLDWLGTEPALRGARVLDYGCGSGILAIAARRLGAMRAVGVDIDPAALAVARENAALNGCADVGFVGPDELAAERFDLLVANILLNPLIALAPTLLSRLAPGGLIGLSGLLAGQIEAALAAYSAHVDFEPPRIRGEWAFLAGRHRQSALQ
jgi:ribosomal protein L11 methyltransferase